MLSSITMDNQGLTTSASHKFAVESAGPRSPHTWLRLAVPRAPPSAPNCWEMLTGFWCRRCAEGQESTAHTPSLALRPLGTLLHWDSHYGKLFPTQEISVKDSCHVQASSWWVSWFCGIFLSSYFVFQKTTSRQPTTALACCLIMLLYFPCWIFTISLSGHLTSCFYFCMSYLWF